MSVFMPWSLLCVILITCEFYIHKVLAVNVCNIMVRIYFYEKLETVQMIESDLKRKPVT